MTDAATFHARRNRRSATRARELLEQRQRDDHRPYDAHDVNMVALGIEAAEARAVTICGDAQRIVGAADHSSIASALGYVRNLIENGQ